MSWGLIWGAVSGGGRRFSGGRSDRPLEDRLLVQGCGSHCVLYIEGFGYSLGQTITMISNVGGSIEVGCKE